MGSNIRSYVANTCSVTFSYGFYIIVFFTYIDHKELGENVSIFSVHFFIFIIAIYLAINGIET